MKNLIISVLLLFVINSQAMSAEKYEPKSSDALL
ncbi:hypothetical protein MNBD_GAMMA07-2656 [hydrothermal vent metagenome]|uniref:Uncharacterized protein n=1 Tax=hydrothermal vent metagenome TaxID=652676 RepID=A0A3B0WJY2_9ZZZZ